MLFDRVIVAVAMAHRKKTLFSLDSVMAWRARRCAIARRCREPFEGLVTEFAAAHGAKAMVRGLRSGTDFDYEFQLAGMNRALAAQVETVFLTLQPAHQFISSTLVREIATLGRWQFVSPWCMSACCKARPLGLNSGADGGHDAAFARWCRAQSAACAVRPADSANG